MNKAALVSVIIVIILVVAGLAIYFDKYYKPPTSTTPSEIVIGMPYASSGSFAFSSLAVKSGFQMWVNQTNAAGGIYLSQYGKKLPLKVDYLDDDSSTSTVASDYTQLITQDHVNILMSDFGSTLVSPGISIAKNNKIVFFDTTGSTPSFFNKSDPYLVDLAIQSSSLWPLPLAQYLVEKNTNISKIAILYTDQDFTTAQAQTVDTYLTSHGITPVYYQSTADSSTSEYLTTLASINATHPQAVLEFGYDTNDIAFFDAMNSGNYHFNMTFTIYTGLEFSLLQSSVPTGMLNYTYTYAAPPFSQYSNVTLGPNTTQFVSEWMANTSTQPNLNNIAGYNSGQLIGAILKKAGNLNQNDIREAANETSGTTTLEGPFIINKTTGMQTGEGMNLMQFQPNKGVLKNVVIFPANVSTGPAVYPAPSVGSVTPLATDATAHSSSAKRMLITGTIMTGGKIFN
ncbi:MAG: ABC transporter substrate-binding protein [Candidatus Thermoplasmatota archaeon]|nr:ABC transporter substrate-binding protein [Candidatus Thermoplasmatota archaeon]